MNSPPPPLPQPHRFTCRQCGFGFDGEANYCPHCGTPLDPNKAGSLSSSTNLLLQIVLCFVSVCAGGFGACAFLLGGLGSGAIGIESVMLVGVPLLISGLCIWGVFRLGRSKR